MVGTLHSQHLGDGVNGSHHHWMGGSRGSYRILVSARGPHDFASLINTLQALAFRLLLGHSTPSRSHHSHLIATYDCSTPSTIAGICFSDRLGSCGLEVLL